MEVFEIVIALLLGGAGLAALARRLTTPYPALVALAGASLALVPGVREREPHRDRGLRGDTTDHRGH